MTPIPPDTIDSAVRVVEALAPQHAERSRDLAPDDEKLFNAAANLLVLHFWRVAESFKQADQKRE